MLVIRIPTFPRPRVLLTPQSANLGMGCCLPLGTLPDRTVAVLLLRSRHSFVAADQAVASPLILQFRASTRLPDFSSGRSSQHYQSFVPPFPPRSDCLAKKKKIVVPWVDFRVIASFEHVHQNIAVSRVRLPPTVASADITTWLPCFSG